VNLGLNAVDAMPGGGTILLETERSGVAHATLRVSDTGH
jgi:signal transduction histidine kinase